MFTLGRIVLATEKSIGRNPPPIHLPKVNCVGPEGDINECPQDDTRTPQTTPTTRPASYKTTPPNNLLTHPGTHAT